MSNSNLINVNEETTMTDAYALLAEERRALKPEEVIRAKLGIAAVVAMVHGVVPRLKPLRREMAKLPGLNLKRIDRLELCATALGQAQINYLVSAESPDALPELAEEAVRTSKLLYLEAQALASCGLINPASLDDYSGGTGYQAAAMDLQLVVTVLQNNWGAIEGKCAVESAELERAEKVAARILRLAGMKTQAGQADDPALDERDRAYTLVDQSYDEVCRAVDFLRYHRGDAETIAPSLYQTRKRRSPGREEPVAPPQEPTPVQRNSEFVE